jgi:hypothetical protein
MLANFVQETANAPGTAATINLGGAAAGRLPFIPTFASGTTVFYGMDDGTLAEMGIGTVTAGSPNTLTRTTVLWNSAGTTALMNFLGSVRVYCAVPAERAIYLRSDGTVQNATATGSAVFRAADAAAARTSLGATATGSAVLTAADAAAARAAIGAANAAGQTFSGPITVPSTLIVEREGGAEGGQVRLQVPASGTSLTDDIIVDVQASSFRVFEAGGAARGVFINLSACSGSVSTQLAAAPQTSAGIGQWVQINTNASTYTLPASGTWAYFWQGYDGNALNGEGAGVAAGGTSFSIGGSVPRFRGFAWRTPNA